MQQIDVYKVIAAKNAKLARRIPEFLIRYLERTIHQKEINEILNAYADLRGIEFIRAALGHMGISYYSTGIEKLDRAGRYIFASNHPFGSLDGLMLADEVARHFGDVRVVVNDLLMNIDPIRDLFVPVNKHGRQNAQSAVSFNDALASDIPIITFPAGLCSRRRKGVVCDLEWKSNFIKKALSSHRDIVPVYFDGRLSNFFYRLSNLRTMLGVRTNIEMLYLPDEMFRLRGGRFAITVGAPIPYNEVVDYGSATKEPTMTHTPRQAAEHIKGLVYSLKPDADNGGGHGKQ